MHATGSATDPLGASASATVTIAAGSTGGVRTIRSSFFANRVNWGNSITETVQGPETGTPDAYQHLAGPYTFGFQVTPIIDCRSSGMRVMKMPAGSGAVTALMWDHTGAVLATASATWVADDGGWYEFTWDAPVAMTANTYYTFGYHYPTADSNWAYTGWVWNNGQDTFVYPLNVGTTADPFSANGPMWLVQSASPTLPVVASDHRWHNYYIDPMVEWDTDVPGYESGTDYFNQFPNGGSRFAFPCIIDFADPQWLEGYAALGMNTLAVTPVDEDGTKEAVKATGMDWYPLLAGDNMTGPQLAMDDPEMAQYIRGYFLTDEPEWDKDAPVPTVRQWRDHARKIDSTRPIYINLGRMIIENQGFQWQPVGISAKNVNLQWREYLSMADINSMDGYGIAHTYPYYYQGDNDSHRYGIWIYPLQIKRMRTEMSDGRVPIWGEVETTSEYPNSPTPEQVRKCVWSMLIAGAKGILYFDHRFPGPAVSKDFAAMLRDPAMSETIQALNAQMISLADALNAGEADLIASATGTGVLAKTQGGLPQGVKVPIHYSSRVVGSTTYFFVQSIRDGDAGTVTVSIPGFAGASLTVIGESRAVTVDGSGVFTDTFTGDYDYHLYSTTATPSYVAPVNTVAPVITTDGSPMTGETVSTSTGTWTGTPTPTRFTYLWQRSTDSGTTWINIPSATTATYTLTSADAGNLVRSRVTATNIAGSTIANSDAISPVAPPTPQPPVNTVAPVITDDGTPTLGETVTVSTGTWTGYPTPTYTYQWQRSTDSGTTWSDIASATGTSYTIVADDQGNWVQCAVTGTNASGSATAVSGHIAPPAPVPSTYSSEVLADSPTGYWRLADLTDSSGNGHTLTVGHTGVTDTTALITDAADGAKFFDTTGSAYLTTPDATDLRLGAAFSVEAWIKPGWTDNEKCVAKGGDFIVSITATAKFRFTVMGIAYQVDLDSTNTYTPGSTYHVVGTWDQATKIQKIYVNGVLDTTLDCSSFGYVPTSSGWGALCLGSTAGISGFGGYANGALDEVAIYNTVLSATRIAAHYTAGTA